jgi:hypothetical protein
MANAKWHDDLRVDLQAKVDAAVRSVDGARKVRATYYLLNMVSAFVKLPYNASTMSYVEIFVKRIINERVSKDISPAETR